MSAAEMIEMIDAETTTDKCEIQQRRTNPALYWQMKYSGDRSENLNFFIMQVEELKEAYYVTDDELLRAGFNLFDGPALEWFRVFRKGITDWNKLKEKLRNDFLPISHDNDLFNEIRFSKQRSDETVVCFVSRLFLLFQLMSHPPDEKLQLEIVMKNLAPNYQHLLAQFTVKTIEELIQRGKQFEDSIKCTLEAEESPVSSLTISDNTGQRSNIVCWNCSKPGHHYLICSEPKLPFCHGCGMRGIDRNCDKCAERRLQRKMSAVRVFDPTSDDMIDELLKTDWFGAFQ